MFRPKCVSLLLLLLLITGCSQQGIIRQGDRIDQRVFAELATHRESALPHANKGLWITFWATWCEPCRAEWPDLEIAAPILAAEGIDLIAINVGESTKDIDQFLDQYKTSFAVLRDQHGEFAQDWGVYGMPTHVLIDQSGVVLRVVRGPLSLQRAKTIFGIPQPETGFSHGVDGK